MKVKIFLFCVLFSFYALGQLPKGFVYVEHVFPDVELDLRYLTKDNFVGKHIDGYKRNVAILSEPAAKALKNVQDELRNYGLSILIYDSYRPQQAVNHFVRWARNLNDTINKQTYYPDVPKNMLFKEGYIASKSGHSRGSTIDLTIVDAKTCQPLDMGSPWDYFGKESWIENPNLTAQQQANRLLLQSIMLKHGFRNYPKEWWHFTLRGEPYPETYFDFPVD